MVPWNVALALRLLRRTRPGRERFAAAALERLQFIMLLLVIALLAGTFAQMWLSHLDFFDAFYFTLITVGAIGYDEPAGITFGGRIFNIFMIAGGLALMAGATATLVSLMLELDLDPRRARMELAMERLHDHYIVCGAGDVGRHVIDCMRQQQVPFIVLE
ncbi:MAG: potassium channel family protein, partial [bacterium]